MPTPLADLSKIREKGRPGHNPYFDRIEEHPDLLLAEGADAWKGRWAERFGREAPLVVELGSGSGNWLIAYAGRRPEANCLGLEIRFKRLVRSAEKTAKAGLTNLQFARYSATQPEDLFEPESVSAFVIQFPEPWSKLRQRKHRIFTPDYFAKLEKLLVPQGRIRLKSDHAEYFSLMRDGVRAAGLEILTDIEDLRSGSQVDDVKTEFEMMFRSKRVPIRYLEAAKAP